MRREGVELVIGVRADAGIGRYPQLRIPRLLRRLTILIFVPQGKIQKRGTDMDQNVNYYGIILLLRQLRESGSFSEKELRRVAARIAADSGADIMISL